MIAHGAASLQSDRLPGQRIRAVPVAGARLDPAVYAIRGDRRGITRLADQARDVIRLGLDELHVARARAHVLRRDIAAFERLDVTAVRSEQRLPPRRPVVTDDHALPAAQVESRHGRLVGHAARQPEGVDERILFARVVPEARAAQRGTEHRGADGDDAAVAAGRVAVQADLLVLLLGDPGDQVQTPAFPGLVPW